MRTRGDCQSVPNNDDQGQRKRTELAMAKGLTKLTKNLKQKTER
jgi:hypothetical protein